MTRHCWGGFGLAGVLLMAACGGSSTGAASPAPAISPTPSGPPTATVAISGGAGLAGPAKPSSITCLEPGVDGPSIRMFAQPQGQPANGITLVITITANSVVVRAATGSGSAYVQREFSGTGVSGFGAGTGAKIDAPLTEIAASAVQPAKMGVVTAITATVDCANQQPGTAMVTVTGTTPGGPIGGKVTKPRVECRTFPQGQSASVGGLIQVGGRTVLIILSVSFAGITVSTDGHYYTNPSPSSGTVTATSAHWAGDVTEQGSGSTLHVSGDATCGSATATA